MTVSVNRVFGSGTKVAVTFWFERGILNEQSPEPEQSPAPSGEIHPVDGFFESDTAVPEGCYAEHFPGQLMPEPVTWPEPKTLTTSV